MRDSRSLRARRSAGRVIRVWVRTRRGPGPRRRRFEFEFELGFVFGLAVEELVVEVEGAGLSWLVDVEVRLLFGRAELHMLGVADVCGAGDTLAVTERFWEGSEMLKRRRMWFGDFKWNESGAKGAGSADFFDGKRLRHTGA
jgi:hypothetical protein